MTKILTTFLLFTFIAFGQAQESKGRVKETKSVWKTLNGTNYSIQYPVDWELNQSGQMGTTFILFSPLETSKDKFMDNVNLLIQDLTGHNLNLDKYTEISEGQIKTMITNSRLIESKRIKTGSDEYHRMVYTGDQGMFHLKFEQFYWVKSGKAYVLTLTCEQAKFTVFKEVGEAILNSFTFKQ
ncbi:MAG: hypothetical protein IPK35_17060 [Saprospiraceae bacterium]|jgi:hypothetical protein|nr:hypothetical protein [Saprospiraceae bacterium]